MSFAIVAVATILAFGCLVGFESVLGSLDARATVIRFEIAGEMQSLRAGENEEQASRSIDARIANLHLTDPLRRQIPVLFADIESIARRRSLQMTAFRHEGNARFQVTLEGDYPSALEALAELSRSRVASQTQRVSLERAGRRVRATFDLDVLRVGETVGHGRTT